MYFAPLASVRNMKVSKNENTITFLIKVHIDLLAVYDFYYYPASDSI